MELLESFSKHSAEAYTKAIDYSDRLPSGATISSVALSAIDLETGASAGSVVGSGSYSGSTALVPVQAGTDGKSYLITATLTLSNSNVLVGQLKMTIEDRLS